MKTPPLVIIGAASRSYPCFDDLLALRRTVADEVEELLARVMPGHVDAQFFTYPEVRQT
jgi:hypothetical protein